MIKSSNSCQEFNLDDACARCNVDWVQDGHDRTVGGKDNYYNQSLCTLTPSLVDAATIKVYEATAHANRDRSFDLDSLVLW